MNDGKKGNRRIVIQHLRKGGLLGVVGAIYLLVRGK